MPSSNTVKASIQSPREFMCLVYVPSDRAGSALAVLCSGRTKTYLERCGYPSDRSRERGRRQCEQRVAETRSCQRPGCPETGSVGRQLATMRYTYQEVHRNVFAVAHAVYVVMDLRRPVKSAEHQLQAFRMCSDVHTSGKYTRVGCKYFESAFIVCDLSLTCMTYYRESRNNPFVKIWFR